MFKEFEKRNILMLRSPVWGLLLELYEYKYSFVSVCDKHFYHNDYETRKPFCKLCHKVIHMFIHKYIQLEDYLHLTSVFFMENAYI